MMTTNPQTPEEWAFHCGMEDAASGHESMTTATKDELADQLGAAAWWRIPLKQRVLLQAEWRKGAEHEKAQQ